MSDPYLSIRQAAREVSAAGTPCSYWQALHRIDQGRVPSASVAGRTLVHRDDIPKLIEAMQTAPQRATPRKKASAAAHPF